MGAPTPHTTTIVAASINLASLNQAPDETQTRAGTVLLQPTSVAPIQSMGGGCVTRLASLQTVTSARHQDIAVGASASRWLSQLV